MQILPNEAISFVFTVCLNAYAYLKLGKNVYRINKYLKATVRAIVLTEFILPSFAHDNFTNSLSSVFLPPIKKDVVSVMDKETLMVFIDLQIMSKKQ